MDPITRGLFICARLVLYFLVGAQASLKAADLANVPSEDLLKVYAKLRSLQSSDQGAVAENVVWKRDAGTFAFKDGRLSFAVPVEGKVLAAAFVGEGTFELNPPTAVDRHQIERFTKGEELRDTFKEAVFFFTDGERLSGHPQSGGADACRPYRPDQPWLLPRRSQDRARR